MKQKMLAIILSSVFLGMSGLSFAEDDYNDDVPILEEDAEVTEEQEEAIQEGARVWCEEKDDDEKEQCVLDYFAGHNYEGEPSCD